MALDFETADYSPGQRLRPGFGAGGKPPDRPAHLSPHPAAPAEIFFTYLHGITWEDVAHQPTFAELWPSLTPILEGVDFLAAHNASFDRSVLHRCCETAGLSPPALPFQCTVQLARQTWNIYPTKLNNVCDHLGITLKHHFAASDAEACALIVIAAHRISQDKGFTLNQIISCREGPACPSKRAHTQVRPYGALLSSHTLRATLVACHQRSDPGYGRHRRNGAPSRLSQRRRTA